MVRRFYKPRRFDITYIHAYKEFECLRDNISPTKLNISDTDDYIHKVERLVRTIKEQVRCTVQRLPHKKIQKLLMFTWLSRMLKSLIDSQKGGISKDMSTLTIMTGKPFPNYKMLTL